MSTFKKLASQTALYGLSSILGRLLNYLLVPLHTKIFNPEQFGVVTELYAYMAFFNVLYTYGMETTFFRFATKQPEIKNQVYKQALSSIIVTSVIFSVILIALAKPITILFNYQNKEQYIYFLAIILFIDASSAIPFAKLRLENKVLLFVITKITVIVVTILLNFLFLLLLTPEVKYVFIANLIANALIPIILFKELTQFKFTLDKNILKAMLVYGLPIMLMGLAGMVNEVLDRIMLRYLYVENQAYGISKIEAIGIYGACYKLSIFMSLVVQAFRYSAEPFFFSKAEESNNRLIYANVMKYFVIACCVILIAVTANLSWIKFFLMNELYWQGLIIVPVLLLANLFLGVYSNLSIWFKLTDKTFIGTIISILGALITIVFNIILIPYFGYLGSAITTLVCYFAMAVICYILGQKYYPVPYNLISISAYIILASGCSYFAFFDSMSSIGANTLIKNLYLLIYIVIIIYLERRQLQPFFKTLKNKFNDFI